MWLRYVVRVRVLYMYVYSCTRTCTVAYESTSVQSTKVLVRVQYFRTFESTLYFRTFENRYCTVPSFEDNGVQ